MLYDSVHTETHNPAANADTRTHNSVSKALLPVKAFRRGNVDDRKISKSSTSLDYGNTAISLSG